MHDKKKKESKYENGLDLVSALHQIIIYLLQVYFLTIDLHMRLLNIMRLLRLLAIRHNYSLALV